MHRPGATPTQNAAPLFSTNIFGSNSNAFSSGTGNKSRPVTSSGEQDREKPPAKLTRDRDRRPSFGRKGSFSSHKRRSSSSAVPSSNGVVTDTAKPPALPDFALATATKISRESPALDSPASIDSFSKMLGRTAPTTTNGYTSAPPPPSAGAAPMPPSESSIIHQHIQEIANKRISTLDYLRKAHEGRVYWFNTLLFDKPDLARMPYFDSRKIARRATNYLLLGLSLPTVIDLNSNTPLEFLRSLNTLLSEFDSFQQIHTENGTNVSSLSRARLPQMFRRGPAGKGRRTSGTVDMGYLDPNGGGGAGSNGAMSTVPTSVISFGLGSEGNDLIPGEEYTHLLTPSLPFDPDFYETFATLCDVLIDSYTRLLSLLPTPRECSPPIAELFTKADSRVRKIIVHGVVKEFEESSRTGLKTEVANVGKVVLGGLV